VENLQLPHSNTVLCVAPGYAPPHSGNPKRDFYLNFYANSRPTDYVMATLKRSLEKVDQATRVDLVVDPSYGETVTSRKKASDFFHIELLQRPLIEDTTGVVQRIATKQYDYIVLVFRDALGFGCEAIEPVFISLPMPVFVLNGRGRIFRLDHKHQRMLRRRRWIARTGICECLFASILLCVAACLASVDRFVGVSAE
jgi:hypothetical protein